MSQKALLKPSSWVPLLLPDRQAPTRSPKREESVLARKPSEKHIHRNKPMGGSSAVRGQERRLRAHCQATRAGLSPGKEAGGWALRPKANMAFRRHYLP